MSAFSGFCYGAGLAAAVSCSYAGSWATCRIRRGKEEGGEPEIAGSVSRGNMKRQEDRE